MQTNLFKKVQNSSFKGCLLHENFRLLIANSISKGSFQWIKLKQTILSQNVGIILRRDHFASPIFSAKINQFIHGGFFNHWMAWWINPRYVLEKPPNPEPVVLTMSHVEVGFVIWLLMIFLATAAFCVELVHYWSTRIWKTVLFYCLLQNFWRDLEGSH